MLLIAALGICCTVIVMSFVFYRLFCTQVFDDLRSCANIIQKAYEADPELFETEADFDTGLRITVIDSGGRVEWDSAAPAETMDSHADRPEVLQALEQGEGQTVRNSETLGKNRFYYALRMDDGRILRVSKEASGIEMIMLSAVQEIGLLILILLVVCGVLASLMTKRLVEPVEQMAEHLGNTGNVRIYKELQPFVQMIQTQHEDIIKNALLRQEFTANVSHELKTPLTSISGYAELMEMGLVSSQEDTVRFAHEIHQNANRLLTLINDTIQLSSLDAGQRDVVMEEVNLYEVMKRCESLLEINAVKHKVTLEMSGDETAVIYANKEMIEEIICNLCDNGIRYNKPGGSVWATVMRTPDDRISFAVKDTGIGIPQQDYDRIFERFYRVDKSRSKQTGGTGLGLAIVKHIALLHEAEIRVESEEGAGTEIQVIFKKRG